MDRVKATIARLLVLALTIGLITGGANGEALAKKPKLSVKKVTVVKGKKKKVTVKNAKKYKISWKIKNKKTATCKKSGRYGVTVKAKKVGKTTLICTCKRGKKTKKLKCPVIVKDKESKKTESTPTKSPTPSTSASAAPSSSATAPATATPTAPASATPVPASKVQSIKEAYAGDIANIGTCLRYNQTWGSDGKQMQDKALMELVDHHFNSVTLENEMKPEAILGSQQATLITKAEAEKLGYYLDGYSEEQVPKLNLDNVFGAMEAAKANGLRMRAHTLMWHQQTPSWFFHEGYDETKPLVDKDTMNARLEFFVRTMVSQVCAKEKAMGCEVGDVVYCWDVVNEYIHRSNAPTGSSWVSVYGDMGLKPTYVKDAFRYAYDELKKVNAQDKVTLFFNDYDTYFNVDDEIAVLNFINEDEKICGGMGMQSHVDIKRPTIEQYKAALEAFLKTGLEVQITELDITINFDTDDSNGRNPSYGYRSEGETDADQAAYTAEFMKMVVEANRNRDKAVSPKGITGITMWGIYDTISWRSQCKPLFFTRSRVKNPETNRYEYVITPKPSFYSFIEAVK